MPKKLALGDSGDIFFYIINECPHNTPRARSLAEGQKRTASVLLWGRFSFGTFLY